MLWKPYSQRLFFWAFDKRNSLELCRILKEWRSSFWGPCVGRWTTSVFIWGSEGVCSIKWIFPSICEVPVWSLEIEIITTCYCIPNLHWITGQKRAPVSIKWGSYMCFWGRTWSLSNIRCLVTVDNIIRNLACAFVGGGELPPPQITVSHGNHSSDNSSCWGLWINQNQLLHRLEHCLLRNDNAASVKMLRCLSS